MDDFLNFLLHNNYFLIKFLFKLVKDINNYENINDNNVFDEIIIWINLKRRNIINPNI